MNLEIIIEKVDDDIAVPLGEANALQIRSDGIMLNGELHFWEEIITVTITNREVMDKIKEKINGMKKPEKRNTNFHYNQENCAYNQGLSAMETYYQGSELNEDEMKKFLHLKLQQLVVDDSPDEKGYTKSGTLAQAIISARDKKRKE